MMDNRWWEVTAEEVYGAERYSMSTEGEEYIDFFSEEAEAMGV